MIVRTQQGSFLIEAMLAVVVLGCALVVLMRSYVTLIAAVRVQTQYTHAILLLDEELDAAVAKGFIRRDRDRTQQKSVGDDVFEVRVAAKPVAHRRIDQVEIAVRWPAGSDRQRSISAVTYLLDEEDTAHVQ
jgi:hypothetical protein